MTLWSIVAFAVHSLLCLGIIGLSMDMMRRAQNEGRRIDMRTFGRYLMLVGAFGYLVEPFFGIVPTFSDMMFEAGVLIFLAHAATARHAESGWHT